MHTSNNLPISSTNSVQMCTLVCWTRLACDHRLTSSRKRNALDDQNVSGYEYGKSDCTRSVEYKKK